MAFVRGYKRYETKERKSIEIGVDDRLMIGNRYDAEQEILVNPGVIELQEPAAAGFQVPEILQRRVENFGRPGKKVILPVRNLPCVDKMAFQQQPGFCKSLPLPLAGQRGDDILRM
jgi:hypothetical protein